MDGANILLDSYNTALKTIRDIKTHPHKSSKVAKMDATIIKEEERKMFWAVRASARLPPLFFVGIKSGGWNRAEYQKASLFKDAATEILNSARKARMKGLESLQEGDDEKID